MNPSLLPRIAQILALIVLALSPSQYSLKLWGAHLSAPDLLLLAGVAIWAFMRYREKGFKALVPAHPLQTLREWGMLLLFPACLAISILSSCDRASSAKETLQALLYFLAAPLLFLEYGRSAKGMKNMLTAFFAISAVAISFGLYHYRSAGIGDFEVRASFGNRNIFGGFLALSLPFLFAFLLQGKNVLLRLFCAALIVTGLACNLSGGAMIAILSSLLLLSSLRKGWLAPAFAAVMVAAWIYSGPMLPRNNDAILLESISLYKKNGEPSPRYPQWQAAISMWKENPLLGTGAGCFQENIGSYYGFLPQPNEAVEPDSNNLYLVLLASSGLFGLVSFLVLLAWAMGKALKLYFRLREADDRAIALGAFGGVLAFSLGSIWTAYLVRGLGIPFVFLLALLILLDEKSRSMNT